ncbi:PREDICTED: switch-associated protein 70-like [Nicrophorus vespilloides]|uniref:Switch-associated protein 70-like n=1 Tax=Nicrophorus vespilloides TaxID=110193 RepID=A0ABM1NDW2_NICVS|nr:PREDICTED: switch-associated protein 70-like [Nicrophorus vespilloides]
MMASVLLENVTNCVWQAFAALQLDRTKGYVYKSRLKVLTANIGTFLDLYGIEKCLEHYKATDTLTFDYYKTYLQKEVFASLPDKLPLGELRNYEANIAEVCWLVCRKGLLQRENRRFDEDAIFKLFRVFCFLAELVPDDDERKSYQVVLHPSEASHVAQQLSQSLGCDWDEEDFTSLSVSIGSYRLAPFIAILETRCLENVKDSDAISEAVNDLHQTFVDDVIKKGMLSKKGYIFPTMREYWFILRPGELSYYKTRSERIKAGSISIETGNRIETKPDNKVVLHTSERNFELGTADHMTRLQWISALQTAIEHSGGNQSYQRLQAAKRRLQRQGRLQEMLRAKAQLQKERSARQAAEGQAKELEATVKEESKRLCELEQIKENLQRLLEEETQAKRDEEIVRALQARVLAEEWEKREELENLQKEQIALLDQERGKRREFEELQSQKEQQLKEAENKLKELDIERKILDDELKQAINKIKRSEGAKEVLEARLMQVTPMRDGDRIRRAHSFIPSTRERPILLEVRTASLKRPNKQHQ